MEDLKEIWKPIKGYESRYEVSNLGRVRSLPRLIIRSKMGNYLKKGQIIRQGTTTHGYKQVFLYINNVGKMHLVHRLVAQAFLEHIEGYNEVNHKDENKENNSVSNLEWCNRKYNQNYGTLHTRRKIKLLSRKTNTNTLISI